MIVRRSIVLLAVTLAGCAATGPAFTPAENIHAGEAVVYIYRYPGFALGARSAYFYVNDINVFDLDQRGYSWISLPPGHYTFRQKWPIDVATRSTQFDLDLKPGEIRYLSFETGGCPVNYGGICIGYVFREQSSQTGQATISSMRFQNNFGQAKLQALTSK